MIRRIRPLRAFIDPQSYESDLLGGERGTVPGHPLLGVFGDQALDEVTQIRRARSDHRDAVIARAQGLLAVGESKATLSRGIAVTFEAPTGQNGLNFGGEVDLPGDRGRRSQAKEQEGAQLQNPHILKVLQGQVARKALRPCPGARLEST